MMPPPGAKPVDLGTGSIAASFGCAEPSLISVARPHASHGMVELTDAPPFDEAARGQPDVVRAYRTLLAADASACCWLETPDGTRCTDALLDAADPAEPRWRGRLAGAELVATARAVGDAWLELTWQVDGWGLPEPPRVRFAGRLALPAIAEITDTDPPAMSNPSTSLRAAGGTLIIACADLSTTARLVLDRGRWRVGRAEAAGTLARIPSGVDGRLWLTLRIGFDDDTPAASVHQPGWASAGRTDRITARAVAYVRGCTALRTAPGERVILTDHRLLPLSWTRDAYYQALLLLAAGSPADAELVADHLRWLWRRCERPDGWWARSHLANGRRKDLGFQADQQLYPLLELCDYWRFTRALPDGVDWTDAVAAAWQAILTRIDPDSGLLATVETAADDPAAAPFVGSTQILLWYVELRLAQLADAGVLGLDWVELRASAESARAAFGTQFESAGPWPYAVDGKGATLPYHDANDLPLALAPLWGFCAASDAGWRATVDFAWSGDNPGWFDGERSGLGSVHTPHPWALGNVQDWVIGRVTGDAARRAGAVQRLEEVALADGMLPEAYSANRRPDHRIRHWFAWPGAAYGALRLLDGQGVLETCLRAEAST
jgi:hypothetical protein